MLDLGQLKERYEYHTEKLSSIVRQLGFAGIAVIWLFRTDISGGRFILPRDFIWPLALIIVGLGFDLLHYAAGTLIWGGFRRKKEKELKNDPEAQFLASGWINLPALFFFWGKVLLIAGAYLLLLIALADRALTPVTNEPAHEVPAKSQHSPL